MGYDIGNNRDAERNAQYFPLNPCECFPYGKYDSLCTALEVVGSMLLQGLGIPPRGGTLSGTTLDSASPTPTLPSTTTTSTQSMHATDLTFVGRSTVSTTRTNHTAPLFSRRSSIGEQLHSTSSHTSHTQSNTANTTSLGTSHNPTQPKRTIRPAYHTFDSKAFSSMRANPTQPLANSTPALTNTHTTSTLAKPNAPQRLAFTPYK